MNGAAAGPFVADFDARIGAAHNSAKVPSAPLARTEVFLPVVSANYLHTTSSRYYTSTAFTYNFWVGCNQGAVWPDQASGVIILDFGEPYYLDGHYGTLMWPYPPVNFRSIEEIEDTVKYYIAGFVNCALDSSGHQKWGTVYVAAGVNNSGPYVGADHGAAWAMMVNNINQFLAVQAGAEGIVARGAFDAEPTFGFAAPANYWADGYSQTHQGESLYYNFGSCDGCPTIYDPNWLPNNGWTMADLYHVSWGASAALPFPEIYLVDGTNAWQWQYLTLWSYLNHGANRMYVKGVLTQWTACQTDYCPIGTDNRPYDGMQQLRNALDSDWRTNQHVEYSSDIRWPRYDYVP